MIHALVTSLLPLVVNGDDVIAVLTSIVFGFGSALVPLVNAEAYVVLSQGTGLAGATAVAVGVSIGQAFGKLALFLAVRRGKQSPFLRRKVKPLRANPGPLRRRFRAIVAKLLCLVGTKRWGIPIVLLAAVLGLPPLYAVALLAGATKMRAVLFFLAVLVGRLTRFLLLATGVGYGLTNGHF